MDAGANAFIGYVNLNSHVFTQGTLPPATVVSNLNFIFKDQQVDASWVDQAGGIKHQTGDLKSTNYGFTGNLLIAGLGVDDIKHKNKSFVSEGKLYTTKQGNLNIKVIDFSGRIIKTINLKSNSNGIEINLPKKGNYILKVNDEVIKFAY